MKPERGIVADGVYRNTYFKVALPVNEGDYIYDDRANYDQVKAAGMPVTEADWELADGVLTYEEMEKVFMGRNREFLLMGAESKFGIVVQYENMKMVYNTLYTEEQYEETIRNQYTQKDPQADISTESVYLGWLQYKRVTVVSGGYQINYYFRAQDQYMVVIVYTRYDGNFSARDEFEVSIP